MAYRGACNYFFLHFTVVARCTCTLPLTVAWVKKKFIHEVIKEQDFQSTGAKKKSQSGRHFKTLKNLYFYKFPVLPIQFLKVPTFSFLEMYVNIVQKIESINIKQTNIKVEMVFLSHFFSNSKLHSTESEKKVSFCSAKDHQDKILASSLSLNP